MRYTRMEISKNTSSAYYRIILEFFIIIPIVATILGSLITKTLIIPYFNKNISSGKTSEGIVSKPIIIGKEYTVSMLQAGVFLNKSNAETLVKGLASKSQNAFLAQDDDSFRIIMEISENRAILEEKQKSISSSGYSCLIRDYGIYIKNQNGQENKSLDKYKYELACLIKLEFQYKEALSQNKEFNLVLIKNNIQSIEKEYNNIKESGISKEKFEGINKYHNEILKLGNEIVSINDLKELLPRLANQIILIDKLSNVLIG